MRTSLEQDSLFGYIWPLQIPLFFPGTPSLSDVPGLAGRPGNLAHPPRLFLPEPALRAAQEQAFMDWFSGTLAPEDIGPFAKRLCKRTLHSRGYRQGKFVVDRDRVDFSEHHVHFFQRLVYQALMG